MLTALKYRKYATAKSFAAFSRQLKKKKKKRKSL
jgi:hypothetical protein